MLRSSLAFQPQFVNRSRGVDGWRPRRTAFAKRQRCFIGSVYLVLGAATVALAPTTRAKKLCPHLSPPFPVSGTP